MTYLSLYTNNTIPSCSLFKVFSEEANKVIQIYRDGLECDCLPVCSYTGYNYQVSSSKFPNQLIQSHAEENAWPITNVSEIERRYIQTHFYFEDMVYIISDQQPSMDVAQLLANIGGQMGLWIGASVISIMEVFDFLAIALAKRCPVEHKKSKVDVQ